MEWKANSLKIINTLVEVGGLAVIGVGLFLGAGEGHPLGAMVGIAVGVVVVIEGAWLFNSE